MPTALSSHEKPGVSARGGGWGPLPAVFRGGSVSPPFSEGCVFRASEFLYHLHSICPTLAWPLLFISLIFLFKLAHLQAVIFFIKIWAFFPPRSVQIFWKHNANSQGMSRENYSPPPHPRCWAACVVPPPRAITGAHFGVSF